MKSDEKRITKQKKINISKYSYINKIEIRKKTIRKEMVHKIDTRMKS